MRTETNTALNQKHTDATIAELVAQGETILFEILIRRHNSFLYRIGRAYGFNHHDTEDLMQETYIDAYKNLDKFENRSEFRTWIGKIMRNNCYHKKQKHSFKNEIAVDEITPVNEKYMNSRQEHAHPEILTKELGHIMEKALMNIEEDYRMVFTLRELNGMSVTESADVLSISEANVKVRLNRAKKMLRSEIEKIYSPEEIFEFNLIYCDRMVERVMSKINAINTHE
jgi:RNA polymerase sigma-70 factor (ECF subfamily)